MLGRECVVQVPAAFALARAEKIDPAPPVSPYLLEIARRQALGHRAQLLFAIAPDGVHVIVLREHLQKLPRAPGHQVDDATGHATRLEQQVESACTERIPPG